MSGRPRVIIVERVRFGALGLNGIFLGVLLLMHGLVRQGLPVGLLGVTLVLGAAAGLRHRDRARVAAPPRHLAPVGPLPTAPIKAPVASRHEAA